MVSFLIGIALCSAWCSTDASARSCWLQYFARFTRSGISTKPQLWWGRKGLTNGVIGRVFPTSACQKMLCSLTMHIEIISYHATLGWSLTEWGNIKVSFPRLFTEHLTVLKRCPSEGWSFRNSNELRGMTSRGMFCIPWGKHTDRIPAFGLWLFFHKQGNPTELLGSQHSLVCYEKLRTAYLPLTSIFST